MAFIPGSTGLSQDSIDWANANYQNLEGWDASAGGWGGLNPEITAAYLTGNLDKSTLSPEELAALSINQPARPAGDDNHPNGVYAGGYNPNYSASAASGPTSSVPMPTMQGYTQNPYLTQMGSDITSQFNQNLTQNTLPSIRGGAVANGSVGGSRQGIAEGLAAGQSNTGLAQALTGLYGADYNNSMNRNLSQYQGDQNFYLGNRNTDLGYLNSGRNYNLGLGGLANQRYGIDQSAATANRGMDVTMRGQDIGWQNNVNNYDLAKSGLGLQAQQQGWLQGWGDLTNANNIYNSWSGYGTNTAGGTTGGGAMGALGGALGTAQIGSNLNWW